MRDFLHCVLLLILAAILAKCGGGGPRSERDTSTATATSKAENNPIAHTASFVVTTNHPEGYRYFWVERTNNPDEWEQPGVTLLDHGSKFLVDLPMGARYELSLREQVNFIPPPAVLIDLTKATPARRDVELLYGGSPEIWQE